MVFLSLLKVGLKQLGMKSIPCQALSILLILLHIIRKINTFILVSFAWIFFRANTLDDAFYLIKTLLSFNGGISETLEYMELDLTRIILTIATIVILIIVDRALTYDDKPDGSSIITKKGGFVYLTWCIIALWVLLVSQDMVSSFIYFQF